MEKLIELLAMLISPTTLALGMIISKGLESTPWFKRKDFPAGLKFLLVIVASLGASVLLALFEPGGLPMTIDGWRPVALTGIAILVGSQIFHVLVNTYLPGFASWLNDLLVALKIPTDSSASMTAKVSIDSSAITKTGPGLEKTIMTSVNRMLEDPGLTG